MKYCGDYERQLRSDKNGKFKGSFLQARKINRQSVYWVI